MFKLDELRSTRRSDRGYSLFFRQSRMDCAPVRTRAVLSTHLATPLIAFRGARSPNRVITTVRSCIGTTIATNTFGNRVELYPTIRSHRVCKSPSDVSPGDVCWKNPKDDHENTNNF